MKLFIFVKMSVVIADAITKNLLPDSCRVPFQYCTLTQLLYEPPPPPPDLFGVSQSGDGAFSGNQPSLESAAAQSFECQAFSCRGVGRHVDNDEIGLRQQQRQQ